MQLRRFRRINTAEVHMKGDAIFHPLLLPTRSQRDVNSECMIYETL